MFLNQEQLRLQRRFEVGEVVRNVGGGGFAAVGDEEAAVEGESRAHAPAKDVGDTVKRREHGRDEEGEYDVAFRNIGALHFNRLLEEAIRQHFLERFLG